ncbi:uncharacterized protein [Clinocottus analis]|uniref:uncharacterized protein n=1 Tax=Clinocottus analis TaxID=304258 RepID=UPI0035BF870F
MMKAMSFSSGVKTGRAVGWVSVLWFSSAVAIAASQGVTLRTDAQVVTRCGQNVTLTCDANSSRRLDIKLFSWLDTNNKSVCDGDGWHDPEVACERTTPQPLVHTLSLTLLNVMPAHQGEYACKLRSTFGAKSSRTTVTVQDCVERYGSSIQESHAECWFSGVYPIGTVHWVQGDVNFTHSASTLQQMGRHGRYNVSSTIEVKEGSLNQPYECTLWIPSDRKLLASQTLHPIEKLVRSSGGRASLQGVCVMVGVLTLMM